MAKNQKGKKVSSVGLDVILEDGCPQNFKKCKQLGKKNTCSRSGNLCQKQVNS